MRNDIFDPEKYLPGHALEMVVGGEPFFERLLQIIGDAQKLIHFQVYIFDDDHTGRLVVEALKKARKRGVAIYLVVDSYGSKLLSPAFVSDLKKSGIHFKFFSPLPEHFYIFRLGRRLHSKVVVVDNAVALVGGINVADKYRGSAAELPWLDFAIGISGPVCNELSRICERIYREKYFGKLQTTGPVMDKRSYGKVRSRLALNDWFRRKYQIGDGYRAGFRSAQKSIIVVASYFLPSRSIRTALKTAAKRGVEVTVMLPGKSDLPMAKRATRYLYQWLLRNNIRIVEWKDSILHGKLAVVDQKWVTIGSYNLNHLSQYSSIEMNIEVLDAPFAGTVQAYLVKLIEQSNTVQSASFDHSLGIPDRILDWGSYTLARWIMKFLFFLVKREHKFKEKE